MNPDRHIYLATAVVAVTLGAAISFASPHIPLVGATVHSSGASTNAAPGGGLVRHADQDDAAPAEGVGVRAPAHWPLLEVINRHTMHAETDSL
jgi:hypothetical protein